MLVILLYGGIVLAWRLESSCFLAAALFLTKMVAPVGTALFVQHRQQTTMRNRNLSCNQLAIVEDGIMQSTLLLFFRVFWATICVDLITLDSGTESAALFHDPVLRTSSRHAAIVLGACSLPFIIVLFWCMRQVPVEPNKTGAQAREMGQYSLLRVASERQRLVGKNAWKMGLDQVCKSRAWAVLMAHSAWAEKATNSF